MGKTALVLGGGGALGVAWETGVLAGLLEEGIEITGADLIVGTSAGSLVGAHVGSGRPHSELVEQQVAPDDGRVNALMAQAELATTISTFARWAGITEVTPQVRAEIGQMALGAKTAPEEHWVSHFRELVDFDWSERRLVLTAVDAGSGDFQPWDRDSGVPLHRAVASSCSVPALFPPVTINGRRYTDGGVRSGTNADLASGYEAVLIVAPIGARADGIDPVLGSQARSEAEALRAAGSRVELAFPDAGSLDAIGINRMDATRRAQTVEAGRVQGRSLSSRLTESWAKAAATS